MEKAIDLDVACQTEAIEAGVPGDYVALVSKPKRSINQLLHSLYGEDMPIINSKV